MNHINRQILIIDDDRDIWNVYLSVLASKEGERESSSQKLSRLLNSSNTVSSTAAPQFDLSFAPQGQAALDIVQKSIDEHRPFAVAFIDMRMPPGWDGMETAAKIREIDPDVELVIVTAFSDRSLEEIVYTVGAPDKLLFLRKPFDPEELSQMALCLSEKWSMSSREKEAKMALVTSEARFRALVETTNDFVWETDAKGCFIYCSPVSEQIYGYRPEELLGRSIFDTIVTSEEYLEYKKFFMEYIQQSSSFHGFEHTSRKKNGEILFIESSGTPVMDIHGKAVGFRGIDRDITLRKKNEKERLDLEKQYFQSQKLEAVGTLADGIAHDFNNILSGIMGYTQMASLLLPEGSKARRHMDMVMKSSNRAAELVNQILAFSRRAEHEMKPVKVNMIVKEVMKLMRATLPTTIEMRKIISTSSDTVMADATQLHQMLINLCTNAAHAMKKNGGKLEITLSDMDIKDNSDAMYWNLNIGSYLKITVQDNGHGMDKKTMERIFEPFFTTKELGKGTGLGLAVIHGIVKGHKGEIKVYSEPDKGSTFCVILPRIDAETGQEQEIMPGNFPTGNERILFVDDEVILVEINKDLIGGLGYSVIGETSSIEALEIFSLQPFEFDLVITDMTMPRMTGDEFAEKILAIRPDIPIILCSGLWDASIINKGKSMGIREFVMKPVSPRQMAETIRKVLDT